MIEMNGFQAAHACRLVGRAQRMRDVILFPFFELLDVHQAYLRLTSREDMRRNVSNAR